MKKITFFTSLLLPLFLIASCSQDKNIENYNRSARLEMVNETLDYLQADEDILEALSLKVEDW
ncbi:MAG: hypothetical protein IPL46_24635 [Saprospiraceae bacterium]|nr:hypothetical protein [Saprospiraceae bacterium]